MHWLTWIVLGGLSGWIASMIAGTNAKMGIPANILVGILGAVFGGWIANFFGYYGVYGLNLYSLGVAIGGATLLLFIFKRVFR
jgi:uncharacterized membrane protein YeaQ/YmgE (transglycosylase-associated protein family)